MKQQKTVMEVVDDNSYESPIDKMINSTPSSDSSQFEGTELGLPKNNNPVYGSSTKIPVTTITKVRKITNLE